MHHPSVNDEDRVALARQAEGLRRIETDDRGTEEWRASMKGSLNAERRSRGLPPFDEHRPPPEAELHERARALGLLD